MQNNRVYKDVSLSSLSLASSSPIDGRAGVRATVFPRRWVDIGGANSTNSIDCADEDTDRDSGLRLVQLGGLTVRTSPNDIALSRESMLRLEDARRSACSRDDVRTAPLPSNH